MVFNAKAARNVKAKQDSQPEDTEAVEVGGAAVTNLDSAAGVLALAQKLHEEYVAEGQDIRQRLIAEGQSRHEQLIAEATARQEELFVTGQNKHDALIAEADALIVEANAEHERIIGEARERSTGMVVVAQEERAKVLQGLSSERNVLKNEIEGLHVSERDYLARQKAYLEGQLAELEKSDSDQIG
jgi:hypothetical protein